MDIATFLPAQLVFPSWEASCKKAILQDVAHQAALFTGVSERDIFCGLFEREKLGCTSMANGTCIPHARVSGLKKMVALFFRLKHPIIFEGPDSKSIDMLLALLAPADEQQTDHLRALSAISRVMRDRLVAEKLRVATSAEAMYKILTEQDED